MNSRRRVNSTVGLPQILMKRIARSCLGGILLPILYLLIILLVGSIVDLNDSSSWRVKILTFPFICGSAVYTFFFPPYAEKVFAYLRPGAIMSDIAGAFFTFAVSTYVFLFLRSRHTRGG